MSRLSFTEWAISLIDTYAERGTCIRRKAGCVAFDKDNRVVGIGMNGVPKRFKHCTDSPCLGATDAPGNTDNCMAIHAEMNMLVNCHDPSSIDRIFVSTTPCKACGLVLANLPNLKLVYAKTRYADRRGEDILEHAGIDVILP